jgi:hypothetical protein
MPTLDDLLWDEGVTLRSTSYGKHYTTCPQCSRWRKKRGQRKPCLRVEIDVRDPAV